MSCIAAVLERKVYLEWDKRTYPNMYVILVGSSGKTRKGTAMGPGYDLLQKVGLKLSAEATTREALIRTLKNINTTTTDPETGDAVLHSSLTIFSQELTVFLGYNNAQLMADLSDWYDCRNVWKYETKTQGKDELFGVFVNMIGATTPELLQTTLPRDAIGGGLASRIVFVYEDKKGKVVPIPFSVKKDTKLEEDLLEDLIQIGTLSGRFTVTSDFIDVYTDWYIAQEENPPFQNDFAFDGYVSRRSTHLLKMCMAISASRSDNLLINAEHFETAKELLELTERKMRSTFHGVGSSPTAMITGQVIRIVSTAPGKEVAYRDLLKTLRRDTDHETLQQVVASLSEAGFCDVIQKEIEGKMVAFVKERPDASGWE